MKLPSNGIIVGTTVSLKGKSVDLELLVVLHVREPCPTSLNVVSINGFTDESW